MAFAIKRFRGKKLILGHRCFSDEFSQKRAAIEAKLKEEKVETPDIVKKKAE